MATKPSSKKDASKKSAAPKGYYLRKLRIDKGYKTATQLAEVIAKKKPGAKVQSIAAQISKAEGGKRPGPEIMNLLKEALELSDKDVKGLNVSFGRLAATQGKKKKVPFKKTVSAKKNAEAVVKKVAPKKVTPKKGYIDAEGAKRFAQSVVALEQIELETAKTLLNDIANSVS